MIKALRGYYRDLWLSFSLLWAPSTGVGSSTLIRGGTYFFGTRMRGTEGNLNMGALGVRGGGGIRGGAGRGGAARCCGCCLCAAPEPLSPLTCEAVAAGGGGGPGGGPGSCCLFASSVVFRYICMA